jgi:hypothetical protein
MKRVCVIAMVFLLGLGATLAGAIAWWGDAAVERGARAYGYRRAMAVRVQRPPGAGRLVMWLGDSTIMGLVRASYPQLLRRRLAARGVRSTVIAAPVFDAFTYYYVMGPVVDAAPDLIVIVARLSAFGSRQWAGFTYNDLASMIPPRELPRTLLLPLSARETNAGRVLMAQLLRWPWAERALFFLTGARERWERASFWDALGPPEPPPTFDPRILTGALKMFEVRLTSRNPQLRVLDAAIRMATRRGRRVLVIGAPIPTQALARFRHRDPSIWPPRFAVLREAVESAGADFLDLHDALPSDAFADFGGHYNEKGAARLAELIGPVVEQVLGAPPRVGRLRLDRDAPGRAGLVDGVDDVAVGLGRARDVADAAWVVHQQDQRGPAGERGQPHLRARPRERTAHAAEVEHDGLHGDVVAGCGAAL